MKTEYEDGSCVGVKWEFWVFGVGGCFALLAELPLVLAFPPLAHWDAPRGRRRRQTQANVIKGSFYSWRRINRLKK